jgi:hypothetical protein
MQVQRDIQIVRRSGFNRLMAAAATSDILFRNTTAVSGGGFNSLSKTGITTLTDAGATGRVPLAYDPTNNRIGIGVAAPTYDVHVQGTTSIGFFATPAGASQLLIQTGTRCIYNTTLEVNDYNTGAERLYLSNGTGDLRNSGWVLPKGVVVVDDDFETTSWNAAAATTGAIWRSALGGGGAITSVTPSRGGVATLFTNDTVPTYIRDNNDQLTTSLQDAPRIYARFRAAERANSYKAVGLTDAIPGGAGTAPYTNDAVLVIVDGATANANFYVRTVRAGAVQSTDTGVAYDTSHHQWDVISTTAGVVTVYCDGTLVATVAAANNPATNTMLQPVVWTNNTGAAVSSTLGIDVYKLVQSRNTGTGDT